MTAVIDEIRAIPIPGRISEAQFDALMDGSGPVRRKQSLQAIARVAILGGLLLGYDTGVIAGTLPLHVGSRWRTHERRSA